MSRKPHKRKGDKNILVLGPSLAAEVIGSEVKKGFPEQNIWVRDFQYAASEFSTTSNLDIGPVGELIEKSGDFYDIIIIPPTNNHPLMSSAVRNAGYEGPLIKAYLGHDKVSAPNAGEEVTEIVDITKDNALISTLSKYFSQS